MHRIWQWLKSGEYSAGTLKYTRLGLVSVSFWLIWGSLIWTILDQSIPSILPYKLKDMGAGDMLNQVLNRSLSYAVVFVLCPLIGFYSDRHRGRRGRRIPFIMWSTPFVALFLVLIGCHEGLTNLFMGNATSASVLGMEFGKATVAIVIIGALFFCYDIANIFINTVYWYLFTYHVL